MKHIKTTIAVLLALAVFASCGSTKHYIGYTYKPMAIEGCDVVYSILRVDNGLQLNVNIHSGNLSLPQEPTISLKNFDGNTITLRGFSSSNTTTSGAVVSGGVAVPVVNRDECAQFKLTQSDIEFFRSGVQKVRIPLIPVPHQREFKRDKIGHWIYDKCQEELKAANEF